MKRKTLKKLSKSKSKKDIKENPCSSDDSSPKEKPILALPALEEESKEPVIIPRNVILPSRDPEIPSQHVKEMQDLSHRALEGFQDIDEYDYTSIEILNNVQNHLEGSHHIYSLYKLNPEECIYNSLKLSKIGTDNKPIKFEKFLKFDYYCRYFDPNIKIFHVPFIPTDGWNGYIKIKLRFEDKNSDNFKENWEINEQARWINSKFNHCFIFGLEIVSKSFRLSTVTPDGESVTDPFQELSIYTDFLLNQDLVEAIPMLIEQFLAKYENAFTEFPKNANDFFRIIEEFMFRSPSLSIEHFRLLLSLISCIPHSLMQYTKVDFSQFLILLENTDKLQDLESSTYSLEGLVHLMVYTLMEKRENWCNILNCDLNSNLKFRILDHFLKDLRMLKIKLRQEDKRFILENISIFKWVEWIILFKNLAIDNLNCSEFLFILQNLMLEANDSLPQNELKELGDCFSSLINEYFQGYILKMNDVIEFFEVVYKLDKRFTCLLYSESIKSIIWSILNQDTEKMEFRLKCCQLIFTTYYDSFFSDDIYAARLSDRLMKDFNIPFYQICNIFSLRDPFFKLFEKWVDEIISKNRSIKSIISYFNKEMSQIMDNKNLDKMYWNFAEKLLLLCKKQKTQFLDCSQYFEESGNDSLRSAYIEVELRDENEKLAGEEMSDSQKKCRVLELFFKFKPTNKIIEVLVEKQLSIMKYEDSEWFNLFSKPDKQIAWISIISSYENYKEFEYAQSLINSLSEVGDRLAQGNIPLYEIDIIGKQSDNQKSIMINLLQGSERILRKEEKDYSRIIKNIIVKRNIIEKGFEAFGIFVNHFQDIMQDYEDIEEICKEFKKNYLSIKLANFIFPEKMETIIEISRELGSAINSYIFNNYYLAKCKRLLSSSLSKLDISTINSNCRISYKKMKENLSNLFSHPADYPMKKIIKMFSNIKKIDKEIRILITIEKSNEENTSTLTQCLKNYQQHENLINACNGMIDLKEITGEGDLHVLELCSEYIEFSYILKHSTIGEFLRNSARINSLFKDLSGPQKKALIETLQAIEKSKDLVLFLRDLSLEMVQNMKGNVNEYEIEFVSTETVLYLENLWYCIQDIRKSSSNFFDLCKLFESDRDDGKQFRLIPQQLLICAPQLCAITELHTDINCKEEAKKKQISEITKNSTFTIKFENDEYGIELTYPEIMRPYFSIADINELKCRAQLMIHTSHQSFDKQKDHLKYFPIFVDYANSINNIITCMNELYQNGYPVLEDKLRVSFSCNDGNYENVSQLEEEISDLYKVWEIDLSHSYLKHFCLTFLNGKQFWTIENYILNPNCDSRIEAQNILKFMGKSIAISAYRELITDGTPGERLENLGKVLDNTPNSDKQSFVLDQSAKSPTYQGEIILLDTTKYLNGIFSIYKYYMGSFPNASQILFCKSSTHWRELKSFLYRYFKDPCYNIYSLINCENLSQDNQAKFKALFDELYTLEHIKSGLAIITANSKCYLLQYFKDLTVPKVNRFSTNQFLNDEVINEFITAIDPNTRVITSSCAGLGKTKNLKYQASNDLINLITFPIGGDINYAEVCKMLSKLNITYERTILHLNISYTSNPSLLNEILINICLLRTLSASENIFVLDREYPIWIEIANTYGNSLFRSVEYLSFVTPRHLDRFNINHLIVDESMQIVGKYLKVYENKTIDDEDDVEIIDDLTKGDMIDLIQKHFITLQVGIEQITYTQLHIFMSILNRLLINFKRSPFSPEMIKKFKRDLEKNSLGDVAKEYSNMRTMILDCLLNSTKEFTTKYLTNVREIQERSSEQISRNQIDETNEISSLITKYQNNIKWESSNHFHLILLEDGSFIPIYRNPVHVPKNFKKLIFLQSRYNLSGKKLAKIIKLGKYDIEDYSKMTHVQLLNKLNTYNKTVELDKEYAEDEYVMTPDNFLKMNLIYLRVQSGLPVIIMGETGCGKTSLIQFLVQKVLGKPKRKRLTQDCLYNPIINEEIKGEEAEHEKSQFAKINIHAGTTSKDIREKMAELIARAESIEEKLWVFFDEFNTTDSIGMICEIMCERTLDGNPLPSNLAFLGACNPYRVSSKKGMQQNIGIQKSRRSQNEDKLVHIVKPLPETMIDYVWDFGTLTHEDARVYIWTMLNQIQSLYKELFVDIICVAHKHFQETEDVSSVSLRDVSRFIDLFLWFRESICDRKRELIRKFPKMEKYYSNDKEIEISAGILAFAHCYYLRIASDDDRQSFLHKISDSLCKPDLINVQKITEIIETEQNDYISRMDLPKGTALNNALRENIFTIIPCVVNKIPVFICGKPGSSKSLSVQLIFANLRGKKSNDPYFRTLPELAMVHFQGSETCKSEGIIEVFEKAGRYPKVGHEVLPVIVFDEIGLAELSKHNPLKVLHSYLEKENINIGFIGISNWRLDASKMNRALYLARPDPDEKDLKFTALSIYHSYTDNEIYVPVIINLAKSYMGLKQQIQETINANFYGLRDFYHLIKNVSEKFAKQSPSTSEDILKYVKIAIERNFGGTRYGTSIMCTLFNEYYKINLPELNTRTLDLIKDNLEDPNARYLMLIGKPDIATFILDKYLDQHNDRRIIIGSNLANDVSQDNYGFECLNDIIIYMELGISIILKDMNHIYSSLYDLFNQSFAIQGVENCERKYCKISLGANFNPSCYVHPKFHAITLISPDDVEKADAPFLNRFEKHYLSIDTLLNKKQTNLLEKLEDWINSFFMINEQEIVSFTKNHLFPIYNRETLALLILFNSQGKKKETLEKCKNILLEIAPSDILILLELISIDPDLKENIKNAWKELHCINFQDTIKSMIEDASEFDKLIAFTYDKRISGKFFNTNDDEKIVIKEMISFNSKQDLTKELNAFYQNKDQKVFILEVDFGEECNHLPLVKFLIDKLNSENSKSNKKFCILIRIRRNIKYNSNIMLFESWKMKMFDRLYPDSFEATDEIISKNTKSLILADNIFNFEKKIELLAEKCVLSFKIEITAENEDKFSSYLNDLIKTIGSDPEISSYFKEKIWKYLQIINIKKDWKEEIFLNSKIIDDSANLHEAISEVLGMEIESALQLIIYVLEEKSALLSYVQPFGSYYAQFNNFRKQIWLDIFKSLTVDNNIGLQRLNQGNLLKYEYELYFPFSRMDYKVVKDAFNLYKISEMNKNPIQTSFEKFDEKYNKKSIYKKAIDFNGEHFLLQDLYFNDLVSIYLKENLLSLDHKKMILILLNIVFHDDELFEEKLISFMQIAELGVLLCNAIDVLPELTVSVTPVLENILIDIDSFEAGKDENQKIWKTALNSVYKMLIGNMQPHLFNSHEFNVLEYSNKAEKMYYLLTEIELKERASIDSLDFLEFWVLFSKLIAKNNGKWEILLNLSFQAPEINIERTSEIFTDEFANTVFRIVENRYRNSSEYYKFMGSFLKLLVNHKPHYIANIAEELENEEFWQYSTKIMNIITSRSKIKNSIEKLKKNILDDTNADFELISNNYLEEIERALSNQRICSKFGIILSDNLETLVKDRDQDDQEDEYYRRKLCEEEKIFNYFLRTAKNRDINFSNVKQLVSLIMVKSYLDIYCFVVAKKMIISNKENEIINNIGTIVSESDIGDTLKMHCLKKILLITKCDLSTFIQEYPNLIWINRIKELDEEKQPQMKLNLESFLVFPRISEIYKNNIKCLRNILNKVGDQNENDRILNEIESPEQKLALGIAFLNEIFSIYSKEKEMNKNIIIWFNLKEDAIRTTLGQEFYQLFFCYINNFPVNSDLRLEVNTSELDLHRILTILGIFTVALSYSQRRNPISSLFFNENGTIDNLIERFNSRFIFGAEPNPLHKYTQEIYDNFESFITDTWSKKYSKGSTYKCSSDCDYIYIVTKCGGPTQESECPFCGRKIGGTRHKLVEREGHVNLYHREAYDFIKNAVIRHRREADAGLKFFGSLIGDISSVRNLKPASYLAQHFVLSSVIFALNQLGSIDSTTLEVLINPSHLQESGYGCLRRSVKLDYEKLLELSGSNSGHLWEYKIISNLDELLSECDFDPLSSNMRDVFEIQFENKLIIPNLNPQNSILEYSTLLRNHYEIQYSFKDYVNEIISLNNDKNYPYIELFRTKDKPSLENMRNQFLLNQSAKEFRLISIYLENSEEIEKIESLYPIIEFTNKLLDIYNHKILRSDALNITIGEAINNHSELQPLFKKFLEAWEAKGIDNLHYGCKDLSPINFDIKSPLSYFLVDNKALGAGMYMAAALNELAEIQNKYLSQINSIISNNSRDREEQKKITEYPLQKLRQQNIISFHIDDSDLLRVCSFSNPIYGKGREIIYDFERMQKLLTKKLLLAKMIDTTRLDLIQYQFELLNTTSEESGLLLEIKEIIPQKALGAESLHSIELFFSELERSARMNYSMALKDIYTSFNYVICYLRYSKGKNDYSIRDFCKELNSSGISTHLKDSTRISEIKLEYVISLYQIVEARYFPFTKGFINPEYKQVDKANLVEASIVELINMCDQRPQFYPTKFQIEDALMRFIIRNSTADLQPGDKLSTYISRYDFWDISVEQWKIDSLSEVFPSLIEISHSLRAYEFLYAKNHNIITNRTETSQIRQAAAARRRVPRQRESINWDEGRD
ncbi:unnamed protein product [Blepharisma stoltei]|uniref:RZ-type domain-containing protein n=1 Tax=Blepharisma stoltei TaxID=1481888 RepID=A0AAU9JDL6_9CILI|nr:unnamed protein product [Blepharisma stoltei]